MFSFSKIPTGVSHYYIASTAVHDFQGQTNREGERQRKTSRKSSSHFKLYYETRHRYWTVWQVGLHLTSRASMSAMRVCASSPACSCSVVRQWFALSVSLGFVYKLALHVCANIVGRCNAPAITGWVSVPQCPLAGITGWVSYSLLYECGVRANCAVGKALTGTVVVGYSCCVFS